MRYLAFLWALFLAVPIAIAKDGDAVKREEQIAYNECERTVLLPDIERSRIASRFRRYRVDRIESEDHAFRLTLRDGQYVKGTRRIEIFSELLNFDVLTKSVWEAESDKFEIVNVGFKNFQKDSHRIHKAILNHLMKHPNESLDVVIDPDGEYAEKVIKTHRRAVHDAVMEKYRERKPYITSTTVKMMTDLINMSSNSDVFALLRYGKSTDLNHVNFNIRDRLVFTAQISYFGDRDFFTPNLRGLYNAAKLPLNLEFDKLPFEYRIDPERHVEFRSHFYKRFKSTRTAEFVRYALFDQSLSSSTKMTKAVHDRFLLTLLDTVKRRRMKHIIVGADDVTAVYFRRYGFIPYAEIPLAAEEKPPGDNHKEFVYYMDVDSDDFDKLYKRLKESSSLVNEYLEEL